MHLKNEKKKQQRRIEKKQFNTAQRHSQKKTTWFEPQRTRHNTNNYDPYIHYHHTNRSLQNKIPHPTFTTYIKTTCMCPRSIAAVPSSQALPGFLITAAHLCAFLL